MHTFAAQRNSIERETYTVHTQTVLYCTVGSEAKRRVCLICIPSPFETSIQNWYLSFTSARFVTAERACSGFARQN